MPERGSVTHATAAVQRLLGARASVSVPFPFCESQSYQYSKTIHLIQDPEFAIVLNNLFEIICRTKPSPRLQRRNQNVM